MEGLDALWWPRARAVWGQVAFGIPSVVYILNARVCVVGYTGRSIFEASIDSVTLQLTSLGNLRMQSAAGGVTLMPTDGRDPVLGKRLMRALPPEVLAVGPPAERGGDATAYALQSAFLRDASGQRATSPRHSWLAGRGRSMISRILRRRCGRSRQPASSL